MQSIENLSQARIAVIANDAGGAFYLAKVLKQVTIRESCNFFLSGPAVGVFRNEYEPESKEFTMRVCDLRDFSGNYDLVLTGSGWSSDYEIQGINLAKRYNIHTVVLLEHWVNYKRRLSRGSNLVLPNEVWVVDDYAYKIATFEFYGDNLVIKQIDDPVLAELKSLLTKSSRKVRNQILYVTEPISQLGRMNESGEVHSVTEEAAFVKFARLMNLKRNQADILVRVHPSEEREFYMELARKFGLEVRISNQANPLIDLSESREVYGLESIMLAWSAQVMIPTFSLLPIGSRESSLPNFGIRNLGNE
jgi:hypothetical protein